MGKKLNIDLLNEEIKRHNQILEYSFYVGEDLEDDRDVNNLILGEEGDEDGEESLDNENPEQDMNNQSQDDGFDQEMGGDVDNQEPIIEPEIEEPTGDEVEVDVTQLVQGAEEMKNNSDLVTKKMEDLLNKFSELETKMVNMDSITSKIESLQQQVEKRNPTPDEKLEMRSFDSYPYNLKLTDFWAEKEGNYDVGNGEGKEQEYVLTKDDVDNEYNEGEVKSSF